ncbi:MAG: hypothetical protein LBL61_01080 [Elusimicrobiota bacterium]|jgi:hypothetical protein|nr:hypothetical protein [Elusimicrobiota bacterium]
MENKNAKLPLNITVSAIVQNFVAKRKVGERKALELLYKSKLYSLLETPETALWHLSPLLLCDMLIEEIDTGKIIFPEEQ